MVVGILHYWSYLAFYKDVTKKSGDIEHYLEKIINKFNEATIKTEKLYVNDGSIFSFRLNEKERVICSVMKHDEKECLVVLDVLLNHEYHSSKYLNPKNNIEFSFNDTQIVASAENYIENNTEILNSSLKKLPKICTASIYNKTIIVGRFQLEILEKEINQPTLFRISGVAGSGKTTIAELLIYKHLTQTESKILYVTKSAKLIFDVKKRFQHALTNEKNINELDDVEFNTYECLCSQFIYETLFRKDNFKGFKQYLELKSNDIELNMPTTQDVQLTLNCHFENVNNSNLHDFLRQKLYDSDKFLNWLEKQTEFQQYARNEGSRIGREIYEDIRKLSDKRCIEETSNTLIGKKESYGHLISSNILKIYMKHLEFTNSIDLSLMDFSLRNDQVSKYDYIIVDESQDFRKAELKYLKSLLNKNGSIYFFMDSNQSLLDDFNLTSQYIKELAIEAVDSMALVEYNLESAYRMPRVVSELASEILKIKREIIGGALGRDEQLSLNSADIIEENNLNNTDGFIGWINSGEEKNKDELNTLKIESERSISFAIVIPHNSLLKELRKIFPNGMIFTPGEIKGLEFQKILLFNFFSGDYQFNYLNMKKTKLPESELSSGKSSQYFPKNVESAREMGRHSQFFSSLFIAITRTTNSVIFFETSSNTKASSFFQKRFEKYLKKGGEQIKLDESSIEEIIEWIKDNEDKLSREKLLDYCEMAIKKIEIKAKSNTEQDPILIEYLNIIIGYCESNKKMLEKSTELIHELKERNLNLESKKSISTTVTETQKLTEKNQIKKIYTLKDLIDKDANFNIEQVSIKTLEQILPDAQNKNILFLLLTIPRLQKMFISKISQDPSFFLKISTKALNNLDLSGSSPLYALARYEKLHQTFIKMLYKKEFIQRMNVKGLNHIGPDGWSPFLFLITHEKFFEVIQANKVLKVHIENNCFACFPYITETNLIKTFHSCDASIEKFLESKFPALLFASIESDVKSVRYLLKNGANINATNDKGYTALNYAVERGEMNIVRCLLENEPPINVNSQCAGGFTPLHDAARVGNTEVIKYLLEKGAFLEANHANGHTPLFMAIDQGHPDAVKLLLESGANSSVALETGRSALHWAIEKNEIESVKLLCDFKANLNAKTEHGITPLMLATKSRHLDILKCLIDYGARIDETDNEACTAFHITAQDGILNIMKYLAERGVDIDVVARSTGDTALHFASTHGHLDCVKYLVENKANIEALTLERITPLYAAVIDNQIEVVKYLFKQGANIHANARTEHNALNIAATKGHTEIVEFLLENGARVDAVDKQNLTALYASSWLGHLNVVKTLVRHGADLNAKTPKGNNALWIAADKGHLEVVKFLLEKGINVNEVNKNKSSALHQAAEIGHVSVVRLLLRNGADKSLVNGNGFTAMQLAHANKHFEVLKCL